MRKLCDLWSSVCFIEEACGNKISILYNVRRLWIYLKKWRFVEKFWLNTLYGGMIINRHWWWDFYLLLRYLFFTRKVIDFDLLCIIWFNDISYLVITPLASDYLRIMFESMYLLCTAMVHVYFIYGRLFFKLYKQNIFKRYLIQ